MPLTFVGAFGTQFVTEKRAVQVTTDNALVIECKLTIQVGSEFISVSQLPDLGTSNTFTFEINTILRNYLKAELLPLTAGSISSGTALLYGLVFEGTDADGDNISGENVTVGATIGYNFSQDEFTTLNLTNYTCELSGDNTRLLLTDYAKPRKILRDSYGVLSTLVTLTLQSWVIVATDSDLNVLSTSQYAPLGTGTGSARYGSSVIFQASGVATRYFVFLADTPIGAGFTQTYRSKIYSFEVVDTPCNYLELFWINQFGVMESWLFDTNYSDSTQIDKKSFLKNRPVNPSALDRGQDNYKVESVRRFRVWSDFESMETIKFLNSIALSPQVAIKVNGALVPVIVENPSVDNFNYHEPINRITFDLVLANKRINVV
jgi:hypothetical protein